MSINPLELCQIEIAVEDVERSLLFYQKAFGWEQVPIELHDYFVLRVPQDSSFGISLVPSKTSKPASGGVVVYFGVDSLRAQIDLVKAAGGALVWGPTQVPGTGQIAQVSDPDGNRWGLRELK